MNLYKNGENMPKKSRPIVKIQTGKKPKTIKFTSTRSNVKKVLDINQSRDKLKQEIGNLKVKEFFGFLRNPKYQKFFDTFGEKKMSEFLDFNENLFFEIVKNEIYK